MSRPDKDKWNCIHVQHRRVHHLTVTQILQLCSRIHGCSISNIITTIIITLGNKHKCLLTVLGTDLGQLAYVSYQ